MGEGGRGVGFTASNGLAVVRIRRERGNSIDSGLLEGLLEAAGRAEADTAVRGVLLASGGSLFSPGLDLVELVRFDRPAMRRFMARFAECLTAWYALSKPVVAALSGHAVAGGCVLAVVADLRILKEGARIGLNEMRVGVPLPYGVALVLRDSVHRDRLEEVALLGRNYTGADAVAVGLVHEVHGAQGFEEHCLARLRDLASGPPLAFAATKRYLRSPVLERLRAEPPARLEEFLDGWFEDETRRRIEDVLAGLRGKR